jgi:nucleoid-associated protein YgaU
MARPEVTGRKVAVARSETAAFDDVDAYSVEEFCRRHRISVQAFYKHQDEMPVTFNVGTRRLISREAAACWRAERELASVAEAAKAAAESEAAPAGDQAKAEKAPKAAPKRSLRKADRLRTIEAGAKGQPATPSSVP